MLTSNLSNDSNNKDLTLLHTSLRYYGARDSTSVLWRNCRKGRQSSALLKYLATPIWVVTEGWVWVCEFSWCLRDIFLAIICQMCDVQRSDTDDVPITACPQVCYSLHNSQPLQAYSFCKTIQ